MEPAGSPGRPGEARGDDHDLPDLRTARRHRRLVLALRWRERSVVAAAPAAQAAREEWLTGTPPPPAPAATAPSTRPPAAGGRGWSRPAAPPAPSAAGPSDPASRGTSATQSTATATSARCTRRATVRRAAVEVGRRSLPPTPRYDRGPDGDPARARSELPSASGGHDRPGCPISLPAGPAGDRAARTRGGRRGGCAP